MAGGYAWLGGMHDWEGVCAQGGVRAWGACMVRGMRGRACTPLLCVNKASSIDTSVNADRDAWCGQGFKRLYFNVSKVTSLRHLNASDFL